MKRILHVWDQSAVACVIAKYQTKIFGHETKVIKASGYDKFGISAYCDGQKIKSSPRHEYADSDKSPLSTKDYSFIQTIRN